MRTRGPPLPGPRIRPGLRSLAFRPLARRDRVSDVAPETITGGTVDQRADNLSAAVIAAELLMGRLLFTAAGMLGLLLAIRDGTVGPFVDATPKLPSRLGEVVLTALRVEPDERYPGAAEFR